jgi:hypothetical protein
VAPTWWLGIEVHEPVSALLLFRLRRVHVLRQVTAVRRGRFKMENINGKSRARLPWTFSCATMA